MEEKLTIQKILQSAYPDYERTHPLPAHVRKAAKAMIECRTAPLGGHIQACPEGHVERVWYNSCKHRSCPQCAYIQVERWLAKQKARLLECDHYHVIFTIPSELNPLWMANVGEMTNLFFSAVKETVFELLGDKKYLGAKPGMMAALHTWGQTLVLHPHIHCLITGGGLTEEGRWQERKKKGYLLPSRVVRKKFRGKLLDKIRRALKKGKLKLAAGKSEQQMNNLINKLGRVKWHVRIQEKYAHGEGVVTYLARYLRGGPIHNGRLIEFDGKEVSFWYKNNREEGEDGAGKSGVMRLKVGELLGRLFLHVPEPGTQVVRRYGIYKGKKFLELEQSRKELGQGEVEEVEELSWQEYSSQRGEERAKECEVCGRRLVCVVRWPRGGAPPVKEEREKKAA
jgi:hypothetical protein